MALFDSGSPVANVALSDTFNTWRVRTNQINTQAAGLSSNNTFTGTLNTFNNAVTVSGTLTGSLTGNASTATALQTARTIGGVSFNGAANINLPGVNTTGNQNTSGNAATATALQTARTIGGVSFNGTTNINLPGVNTAGNQNTSGTAAVATTVTLVATNTTDATHYPVFVDTATGNENIRTDTGYTYNPSSGILSSTDFNSTSDAVLKENINPIKNALALINNLNGYTFDWKDRNRSSVGVTAQDVEKLLPQLVTEINNHKTVNYNGLIGVLIEAVKELNKKIESK